MFKPLLVLSASVAAVTLGFITVAVANTAEKKLNITGFDRIATAGAIKTDIKVGSDYAVTLRGDPQALERYEAVLERGQLVIRPKAFAERSRMLDGRIEATISLPKLTGLATAGSGDITAKGIEAQSFKTSLAGSGNMLLQGRCESVSYEIAGSGNITAQDFKCKSAQASIAGSGNINAFASETALGKIAGSGNVTFFGKPENVNSDVVGSGRVRTQQ
jgi:hypothetical protein